MRFSPYDRGSLSADLVIADGRTPDALNDAAIFALAVQPQFDDTVYVAGHSLGGTEAEMETMALGVNGGGGATFGATGLPGNSSPGPDTLVDYVDYGDPVGNASTDPGSPMASLFNTPMNHYGHVKMVGSPSDAAALGVRRLPDQPGPDRDGFPGPRTLRQLAAPASATSLSV